MLNILGRTQRLPKDLRHVDFAQSGIDDYFAEEHRKKVLPMCKKENLIIQPGFNFKSIFDRYALGA